MYLWLCGVSLAIALVVNLRDRRMLALTALVGVSIFLPVPSFTQAQFYGTCILAELLVASLWSFSGSRGNNLMSFLCFLMIICHFGGWILDGSSPFSPYRLIIKCLEFSQILTCVALSPLLLKTLRNRYAPSS
jgi:hypothetical protein